MPQIIKVGADLIAFYSRAEWGSRVVSSPGDNDGQPEPKGYLHHEGGGIVPTTLTVEQEMAKMRNLQAYSIDSSGQGWSDIPYNICVFPSGRVYEGRGWRAQSAATASENSESKAVLMIGNYDKQTPAYALLHNAAVAFAWGVTLGEFTPTVQILGHWENPDHPKATSCPGANVDMNAFRKTVAEKIAGLNSTPTPEPPTPRSPAMLVLCTDHPSWPGTGVVFDMSARDRVPPELYYDVLVPAKYAPANPLDLPRVSWDKLKNLV
jgi:hypothetical protein